MPPTSSPSPAQAALTPLTTRIGFFNRFGDRFHGRIVTLSVQRMDVVIKRSEHVPAHWGRYAVTAGQVEAGLSVVGQGWAALPSESPAVLHVHLDDPSWIAPITATLFPAGDRYDQYALEWHRSPRGQGASGPAGAA